MADNRSGMQATVLAILTLETIPCKSAGLCAFYLPNSYTCTHGGGEYCGQYVTERIVKYNKTSQNS